MRWSVGRGRKQCSSLSEEGCGGVLLAEEMAVCLSRPSHVRLNRCMWLQMQIELCKQSTHEEKACQQSPHVLQVHHVR